MFIEVFSTHERNYTRLINILHIRTIFSGQIWCHELRENVQVLEVEFINKTINHIYNTMDEIKVKINEASKGLSNNAVYQFE